MLKADLHLHSKEDPCEDFIRYDAYELIDKAHELGFDVLSITNHGSLLHNKKLETYAKKKGILLIPGIETNFDGHILILNAKKEKIKKIKRIEDLKKIKSKNTLIVAAHPFYFGINSLGKKLEEHINLFDAIEYSHFYLKWLNGPNKKAKELANRFKKPLIGTSDAHNLWRLGTTYTLVESKKDIKSFFAAIKSGKVRVVSRPLSLFLYLRVLLWILLKVIASRFRKLYK